MSDDKEVFDDGDYEDRYWQALIERDRIRERECKTNWIIAFVVIFALFVAFSGSKSHGSVLACVRKPDSCAQVLACIRAIGPDRAEKIARRAGATDADIEQGKACVYQAEAQPPK